MFKKILLLISLLFVPVVVNATSSNSGVYSGSNLNVCTSKYQDSSKSISGDTYFSHCLEAKCSNHTYTMNYYNKNRVTCSNGNTAPYTETINSSACKKFNTKVCNNGDKMYCSIIMYYDCSRTSTGGSFTTTTKTTTTTTKVTNPGVIRTHETTKRVVSTNLSSLKLSSGKIDFSSDKYDYEVTLNSNITSVDVTAVPEEDECKVSITGNNKIKNGSVIKVTVTNNDDDQSVYTIKVNVKESVKKSNNANLKSLKVRNHEFAFDSKITNYSLYLENNETELDIYEMIPEDDTATVDVSNNTNLVNGSKVMITVTASDGKTTKVYSIDIRVKKKSNFIKVIFVMIIILAVLALAYYLYKKFVLDRSGEKYEYE